MVKKYNMGPVVVVLMERFQLIHLPLASTSIRRLTSIPRVDKRLKAFE
jgi:hypothetical protein